MFERILVPLDFSRCSMKAMNCINQFRDAKEVILLNVIAKDPNSPLEGAGDMLRGARAKLEEIGSQFKGASFVVKSEAALLCSGEEIWNAVQRVADFEDASLILMGAECKPNLKGIATRGLFQDLLCYDDTHLMIIYREPINGDGDKRPDKDSCSDIFSNVLLPTDFSKESRTAILFVTKLKGIRNISLLHVIPESSKDGTDRVARIAMGKLKALAGELGGRDELSSMSLLGVQLCETDLRCRTCSERLNITCRVMIGHPVRKLLELAEEDGVSLIALTSSLNSKNSEMGIDAAYEIASSSCRPVLFVRSSKVPLLGRM
jgi:nucleotide-binding universal stress UspA family protein